MDDTGIIPWSSERLLEQSDFKADPNPATFADAYSVISYRPTWIVESEQKGGTSTAILFTIRNLEITPEFHSVLSWMRPPLDGNDVYILQHEQGHFDLAKLIVHQKIVDICKRLYDKSFPTRGNNEDQRKQYAKEDSNRVIFTEIQELDKELDTLRTDYDKETVFGTNTEIQHVYDRLFSELRM